MPWTLTWIDTSGTASVITAPLIYAPITQTTASTVWINPDQTVCQTGSVYYATATSTAIQYVDIDEEDWAVNHERYLEWARNRAVAFRIRTAEQRRLEEERRRIANEIYEQQQREYRQAVTRSRELLLAHLTKHQRETFEKNNWFIVIGGKTTRKYRVRTRDYTANIDVYEGDKISHRLCCHCADVPLHDHHLAQKIALECDEERFLMTANRHAA